MSSDTARSPMTLPTWFLATALLMLCAILVYLAASGTAISYGEDSRLQFTPAPRAIRFGTADKTGEINRKGTGDWNLTKTEKRRAGNPAESYTSYHVTFEGEMPCDPSVMITVYGTRAATAIVEDADKDGFSVRLYQVGSADPAEGNFSFLAVCE